MNKRYGSVKIKTSKYHRFKQKWRADLKAYASSCSHCLPSLFIEREKRSYRRDDEKRSKGTLIGRATKLLSSALC
jgi:hypothetical protein